MTVTAVDTIDGFSHMLWVRIHTDGDLVGFGETFGPQSLEAHIHEMVTPNLISKDPTLIDRPTRPHQVGQRGETIGIGGRTDNGTAAPTPRRATVRAMEKYHGMWVR